MIVPVWNYVIALIVLILLIAFSILGLYLIGRYGYTGHTGDTGGSGHSGCTDSGYTGTIILMQSSINVLDTSGPNFDYIDDDGIDNGPPDMNNDQKELDKKKPKYKKKKRTKVKRRNPFSKR